MKPNRIFPFVLFLFSAPVFAAEFRWEEAIQAYERKDKESPPAAGSTFFVGSSTWTSWKAIPEDFKSIQGVNRGFGGAGMSDIMQVMDRIILPFKPARIAFFCANSDFSGFKRFLAKLWENDPYCEVFFVSIHNAPVREKSWEVGDRYFAAVQKLAESVDGLYVIDIRPAVAGTADKPRESFYREDHLHLNRQGQEVIIPIILERFAQVEKENKDWTKLSPETLKEKRKTAGIP